MTKMPEMVAAFNGFGGGASALVAAAEVAKTLSTSEAGVSNLAALQTAVPDETFTASLLITIAISLLIGTVTFSGSFIAFGKLGGFVSGNPVSFAGMRVLTVLIVVGILTAAGIAVYGAPTLGASESYISYGLAALAMLAFVLGILLVIPIGGADMPVVVALLNSYSGLAASATGFVLGNHALIVSGALVGASGLILTKIMCEGMNRSLVNVLLGGFGGEEHEEPTVEGSQEGKTAKEITVDDAAILLSYATKVIVVPGYGMAVAQAQHVVRELSDLLQEKDVDVKFAIHPVAGRMPGHMNVLLAEANVPYDQLFDMDEVNSEFETAEVALVIGANDVVNPAARSDKSSPIYGMPILNVDHAQNVIVLKRSLRPGYAGIQNDLFFHPKTSMLFGDAKDSISKLIGEIKAL
jgi:NAD(P) transhydrogenase subunit beta